MIPNSCINYITLSHNLNTVSSLYKGREDLDLFTLYVLILMIDILNNTSRIRMLKIGNYDGISIGFVKGMPVVLDINDEISS